MKFQKFLALALIISATSLSGVALAKSSFQSKASAAFGSAIREYKIPGLVVGITRNGKHSFYTTGLASRSGNRRVTPDTLFELGSLSKIFNVTLAALAEQRGQISFNDTAAHYLCSDACSIGDNMTLMDLATHHSGGLPLQIPDDIANVDQLVNWLKGWHPPQPGTRSYSNISIGLLGYITAKAMRMNYTEAIQTVLLPEMGMNNTWIEVPKKAQNSYAFGYDRKTDNPIHVTPGVLDSEAYGIKSSAREMLKLLDLELGRGDVPRQLKAAIEHTHQGQFQTAKFTQDMIWEQYPWPTDVETMVAGNGDDFALKPQPVQRIVPPRSAQRNVILNKTGSTNGFGSYVAVLPEENIGIVVLANRNYPNEARVRATYALIKSLLSK